HDALKRRCLYHWIDHPSVTREVEIVRVRAPEVPAALARQVAEAGARLREMDVAKRPGVAETIDWSQALTFLGATRLEPEQAAATLGALLKDNEDLELGRARACAGDRRTTTALAEPGLQRLVGFGRLLRQRGLPVGTGRILTFCRAVAALARIDRRGGS